MALFKRPVSYWAGQGIRLVEYCPDIWTIRVSKELISQLILSVHGLRISIDF